MTIERFIHVMMKQSLARAVLLTASGAFALINPLWAFVIIVALFVIWCVWKVARFLVAILVALIYALSVVVYRWVARRKIGYPHLTEYCVEIVWFFAVTGVVLYFKG